MPSSTKSGASSIRGSPGRSASAMPAITSKIDGAVLSRRAATATTTRTARSSRRVSMVAVMGHKDVGWAEPTGRREAPPDDRLRDMHHRFDRLQDGFRKCSTHPTYLTTPRARLLLFKNTQLAHRQLVNLERAETRLLDGEATDREAADRQCSHSDRAEGCRAQRKRQEAGRGNGVGSVRYIARHLRPRSVGRASP